MSILIKGMEMPKNCVMCQFHGFGGYKNELIVCSLTGWSEGQLSNVRGCPLIEVPTPHGRLIDADRTDRAFSELRWEGGDWRTGKLKHWGDRPDWCLTGAEVESLITAAPTIIEAEEGEEE